MVVPVHPKVNAYCEYVACQLRKVGGLNAECNLDKGKNMRGKIQAAIEARFSFVAVVGEADQTNLTVALRPRDDQEAALLIDAGSPQDAQQRSHSVLPLADCVDILKRANMPRSQDVKSFDEWNGCDPRNAAQRFHRDVFASGEVEQDGC